MPADSRRLVATVESHAGGRWSIRIKAIEERTVEHSGSLEDIQRELGRAAQEFEDRRIQPSEFQRLAGRVALSDRNPGMITKST